MELVLDTSTRYASVAVAREGVIMAELSWRSEREPLGGARPGNSPRRRAGRRYARRCNGRSRGPGTGRVQRPSRRHKHGKGLRNGPRNSAGGSEHAGCGSATLPGYGAARLRDSRGRPAKVYAGQYPGGVSSGHSVESHEDLAAGITEKTLLCGEGLSQVEELVRERVGDLAIIAGTPPPTRRPAVLAHLGYERLQSGDAQSPESLEPIYMRAAQIAAAQRNRKE